MTAGPLVNLFWMLPEIARERVLVLRVPASPLPDGLAHTFAQREEHVVAPAWPAVAQAARAGTGDVIDCALVDIEADAPVPLHGAAEALGAVQRRLRRHAGVLVVRQRRAPRRTLRSRAAQLASLVRVAGARDVRAYYVVPSLDQPLDLVPVDIGAVMAWDDQSARKPLRRAARRLVVRSGLHDQLFDDVLVIGIS